MYCHGEPGVYADSEFERDASGDWVHKVTPRHYQATGMNVDATIGTPGVLRVRFPGDWNVTRTADGLVLDGRGQQIKLRASEIKIESDLPGLVELVAQDSALEERAAEVNLSVPLERSHGERVGRDGTIAMVGEARVGDDVLRIESLGVWDIEPGGSGNDGITLRRRAGDDRTA
jgi:hypothetical protein